MSIENGHNIKTTLESYSSKYAWGLLLGRIADDNGVYRDVIKNYKSLTKENILAHNNTYLGNGNLEASPANRNMLNLTPQTDENHKEMFYKRVRSKMVAQAVENRILTQASWKQIMTKKSDFTWYDPNT